MNQLRKEGLKGVDVKQQLTPNQKQELSRIKNLKELERRI